MFSMFRFLMGDKSVVCRIIRLLILILTIYVSYVLTQQLYRRIECKMCFEVIEKLRGL